MICHSSGVKLNFDQTKVKQVKIFFITFDHMQLFAFMDRRITHSCGFNLKTMALLKKDIGAKIFIFQI